MSFGWAYISCEDIAITSMSGPSGSILVRTGTFSVSGSDNYKLFQEDSDPAAHSLLLTGSFKQLGGMYVTGDSEFSGDMTVAGNLTANSYNVVNTTVSEIEASGSTTFGNDFADEHKLTGSLSVAGLSEVQPALAVFGSATIEDNKVGLLTRLPTSTLSVSGSFAINYSTANNTEISLTALSSVQGVSKSTAVNLNLPVAAGHPGRLLIIKDECEIQPRSAVNRIRVTAIGSDRIDGQPTYDIIGTRAALTLYSNGVDKWFVF